MLLWIVVLLFLVALAYALTGGVFLAFSDFIMRSLALSAAGAGTMQAINREVFRWIFMSLFLGLAPVSLAILLTGLILIEGAPGALIAAAGVTYIIGCFGVTVGFNVPMNNALAELKEGTRDAQDYWTRTYLPRWTFWNTVRTGACVVASGLLVSGLFLATVDASALR